MLQGECNNTIGMTYYREVKAHKNIVAIFVHALNERSYAAMYAILCGAVHDHT